MTSRIYSPNSASHDKWRTLAGSVCSTLKLSPYPDSFVTSGDWMCALVRKGEEKYLLLLSETEARLGDFDGRNCDDTLPDKSVRSSLCPLTSRNAGALRNNVPFLAPVVPGRGLSFGTGDRLGLATPGHIRAIRGQGVKPILAQQSIREMVRLNRSPNQVLDDATWGILEAGYRDGYGADADHLKTVEDIDSTCQIGFTMFTVDSGDYIDETANRIDGDEFEKRMADLPWDELECTADECCRRYANQPVTIAGRSGELQFELEPRDVLRTVIKYARAIAHTTMMYRELLSRRTREQFAFEVAADETGVPTTAAEHYFIASELTRLGVRWESLAPCFVGRFLKGVDYVGDLEQFRAEFGHHVLIAEHFGGYKLSLHSGSDKFTIYPIVAELSGGDIHVKTSGTSYLEALHVVADTEPDLFREIVRFAKQRYIEDAGEYPVDADAGKIADPDQLRDSELSEILEQFDTRQLCHVTYGSVLTSTRDDGSPLFRDRFLRVLRKHEVLYHQRLEDHFRRHLSAFV